MNHGIYLRHHYWRKLEENNLSTTGSSIFKWLNNIYLYVHCTANVVFNNICLYYKYLSKENNYIKIREGFSIWHQFFYEKLLSWIWIHSYGSGSEMTFERFVPYLCHASISECLIYNLVHIYGFRLDQCRLRSRI